MQAIRNVFNAFANLAASVNALAGVLDLTTGRLRQTVALDEALPTVLEHQPAGSENRSLDGNGGSTDNPCSVGSTNGASKSRKKAGTV